MTNDPKVSVVMSVYNGERYLREAVDSILNQTFTDFEFIIINDGSTDRTREILESYNDPRIILIQQENMGLTKSLNKGIALAKGKYIARQDADDISMPKRLEKQFKFLEDNKSVALLGTFTEIIDEKGVYLHMIRLPTDDSSIRNGIKQKNYFCHGSVMFTRQSFLELGGYREFFFTTQDYDLWLRFVEKYKVANHSTPLYKRRIASVSISVKNLVHQRRMGIFARQLAVAREKGISEVLLINELENYLKSPLSLAERKSITCRYMYWTKWLLRQNKIDYAYSIMAEGTTYHPSKLYKLFFRITKIFRPSSFLNLLIKLSYVTLKNRFESFNKLLEIPE